MNNNNNNGRKTIWRRLGAVLAIALLVWLYTADFGKNKTPAYGVTFSQKYARELNLDWQSVLTSILDELKARKFRLVGYWDLLEPENGKYDFFDLDWQVNEISSRGGEIILAIGNRVPRWPECHWPAWTYNLSQSELQAKITSLLKEIVNHYAGNQSIVAWQIDNEPFLRTFGECPKPDKKFYKSELALVKSLDNRPLVATESGELSTWLKGASLGDWLGISVYRVTWNKFFGYFYYPWPPAYYFLKAKIVGALTGVEKIFISELQMEPWLGMGVLNTPLKEQYKSMNLEKFKKNLAYARRTGLAEAYLWGAEWWYWLKQQGDSSLWNAAKGIFNQ